MAHLWIKVERYEALESFRWLCVNCGEWLIVRYTPSDTELINFPRRRGGVSYPILMGCDQITLEKIYAS